MCLIVHSTYCTFITTLRGLVNLVMEIGAEQLIIAPGFVLLAFLLNEALHLHFQISQSGLHPLLNLPRLLAPVPSNFCERLLE